MDEGYQVDYKSTKHITRRQTKLTSTEFRGDSSCSILNSLSFKRFCSIQIDKKTLSCVRKIGLTISLRNGGSGSTATVGFEDCCDGRSFIAFGSLVGK